MEKEFFSSPSSKHANSLLSGEGGIILLSNGSSLFRIYLFVFPNCIYVYTKKILILSLRRNYLSMEKQKPRIYFNWYVERKERLPLVFPLPPPPFFLDLHPFVPRVYQATTNFCGSSFRRKRLIIITIGRTMYHGFYDKKRRSKRRRRRRKENNIEFLEGGCAVRNEL